MFSLLYHLEHSFLSYGLYTAIKTNYLNHQFGFEVGRMFTTVFLAYLLWIHTDMVHGMTWFFSSLLLIIPMGIVA